MMVTRYLQLVGMNLMWIVLHAVFWDGNAATLQDVMDSLLSPGAGISTIITPLTLSITAVNEQPRALEKFANVR